MPVEWIDVEQNTDEWFSERLKIITSSPTPKIMAHYEKGKWGDPAIAYARQKANERVTGVRNTTASFKNKYMERGHELEPIAIRLYEKETFYSVTNGGFFHYIGDDMLPECGDSPDGLVGKRGCIEVKSVIENTQWIRIEKGGYDTAYKWQIQSHMMIGDRDWCDFISYCPEVPESKRLYIFRVKRDGKMIDALAARMFEFEKLIQEKVKLIS